MRRLGFVLATSALVMLAACGGGSDKSGASTTRPATPKLVELADACVLVNTAAEKELGGTGIADPDRLGSFARSLDVISEKTDLRGRDAVQDLATRARVVSQELATSTDASARLNAGIDMLKGYKQLQDSCRAVGSPLSVPGSS